MNKLMMQVGGVVAAVTIFALLAGVGYLTQIGLTQTFGPSDPGTQDNIAERKPRGNRVFENRASPDDPPRVEGWVDVPEADLTNEARVVNRPGNYLAVSAMIDFFDGLGQVEPQYRNVGFPLMLDSEWIETKEDFKAWLQPDKFGVNRNRRRNLELQSMQLFNLEADTDLAEIPESMKFKETDNDVIGKLRKHHAGRLVLVSVTITTEALDSDKTKQPETVRLIMHRDDEGWKVVYIND